VDRADDQFLACAARSQQQRGQASWGGAAEQVGIDRLGKEIPRASLDRLQSQCVIGMAGHHHHRCGRESGAAVAHICAADRSGRVLATAITSCALAR
jgi:hypothetical protein